ncbi:MAG TPA: ECF-type sigma factor [Thermoanaerobaculia bacterium]|nr:ECF-type sigma factor [Thermoanaerobaculia bacterium]
MSIPEAGEITLLLRAHREGDAAAFDRIVDLLYQELRRLASRRWRRDSSATLSATVLVHETYLRMRAEQTPDWQDRNHFLAIAARAMRRVLVDSSRAALAQKRGREQPRVEVELGDVSGAGGETSAVTLLDLERGLETLAAIDARLCRVAECRLFAGLNQAETAEVLGVSLRTVERDWQRARAWLRKEMSG